MRHKPAPQASGLQKLRQQLYDRAQEHPEGSPTRRDLLEKFELSDEALLNDVLAHVDANPGRVGCPSQSVLVELAARTRPLSDPEWEHVLQCFPCSSEVRGLHKQIQSVERRRSLVRWAAVAVLLVLVASGLSWWVNGAAGRPQQATLAQITPTTVDLRTYTVSRADAADRRPPIALPTGHLRLNMLLPIGFDPGSYELQVLDSTLQSRAAASGVATLQGIDITLSADVDLSALASGTYQLAVRRAGEDWQLFPVRLN